MSNSLPDATRQYTSIEVQIEPNIYYAAQAALCAISSSVEEYCALCILMTVRYLQDIPACAAMAPNQLIQKVSADVLEELELCHANKPQNQTTRGVHAHQEEQ